MRVIACKKCAENYRVVDIFEKIKDKVIEIKQKQEETKQERIKPQPIIPQVEELKPVSDQMDINTEKIRALKSKKFAKKEIKQEELW